jgi:hypothetical protein
MDASSGDGMDDGKILTFPFQLIAGGATPEVADVRALLPEDAQVIAQLDQNAAALLRDLGKIETAILGLAQQKVEIYRRWEQVQTSMVQAAGAAASRLGIDPSDTSKAWNLDLSTGQFRRTR